MKKLLFVLVVLVAIPALAAPINYGICRDAAPACHEASGQPDCCTQASQWISDCCRRIYDADNHSVRALQEYFQCLTDNASAYAACTS